MLTATSGYDRGACAARFSVSGLIGFVKMSVTFIFLEWLNHSVIHAAHFIGNPEYSAALIPVYLIRIWSYLH